MATGPQKNKKAPRMRGFERADGRTQTGDPFITRAPGEFL